MAKLRLNCSRPTVMSVSVCMVVVVGIVAPAEAGSTFSVTNLITNNQAVNPADHRPKPGQSLGRFVRTRNSALGFKRGNRGYKPVFDLQQ